ncbi:unnamed protein product [Aphis gossypii]|uniref:Uncharacterized protein n=1 Tax=Aphis gossypii TaxID=80765 RepID=A0A9P0IYH5_APHGO|nr:unnamed protein product [Aphis gossypii]
MFKILREKKIMYTLGMPSMWPTAEDPLSINFRSSYGSTSRSSSPSTQVMRSLTGGVCSSTDATYFITAPCRTGKLRDKVAFPPPLPSITGLLAFGYLSRAKAVCVFAKRSSLTHRRVRSPPCAVFAPANRVGRLRTLVLSTSRSSSTRCDCCHQRCALTSYIAGCTIVGTGPAF